MSFATDENKIGHYPIIWELITRREMEKNAEGDGGYSNNLYSNTGRGGTMIIDGIPVPQSIGNGMGTAMDTIYTWEQIFNSILKFYREEQDLFRDI